MQAYFMVANNTSDFDEDDIWVAGISKEATALELNKVIKARWKELDESTQEFYDNDVESYTLAWKSTWALLTVAT